AHDAKRWRRTYHNLSCSILAIGMLATAGCEPPTKSIPVVGKIVGSRAHYVMASFTVDVPESWSPSPARNEVGGPRAEQRIKFETPGRGILLIRSYGGQPRDSFSDATSQLVGPGMARRYIVVDGRTG